MDDRTAADLTVRELVDELSWAASLLERLRENELADGDWREVGDLLARVADDEQLVGLARPGEV